MDNRFTALPDPGPMLYVNAGPEDIPPQTSITVKLDDRQFSRAYEFGPKATERFRPPEAYLALEQSIEKIKSDATGTGPCRVGRRVAP